MNRHGENVKGRRVERGGNGRCTERMVRKKERKKGKSGVGDGLGGGGEGRGRTL
jgi:hypothetical protein